MPESLPLVMADPALLERAVANLVENACATPPDGKVRVVADRSDGPTESGAWSRCSCAARASS